MKFFDEFKKFIARGNVMDMAVGVVIGSAFTNIVNSLVANIITPAISIITGKINISTLKYDFSKDISITYGLFLQAIIDFLLIALSVFCVVKAINTIKDKLAKKEAEETPAEDPKPAEDIVLLTEIRDLLKK